MNNLGDIRERNDAGVRPLEKYYLRMDNCKNIKELIEENAKISTEIGLNGIFPFFISSDFRNEEKELLYLDSTYFIYEKTYFNKELFPDFESEFMEYAQKLFTESGESPERAEKDAKETYRLLEFFSVNAKDDFSQTDFDVCTISSLDEMMTNADIKDVLSVLSLEDTKEAAVCDIKFEKLLNNMLKGENLDVFKAYSKFAMLDFYAPYLSEDIADAKKKFGEKAQKIYNDGENELSEAEKWLDETLAQVYINKYIQKEEIDDINSIFNELKDIYKKKISSNSDIGEKTKEALIKRIDGLTLVTAEQKDDAQISYDSKNSTFADNIIEIQSEKYKNYLRWHSGDEKIWLSPILDITACYDPAQNCVFLPVGLISEPFYSKSYTKAEKLGGIGCIISHETAHAIDNGGSIYEYGENDDNISGNWEREDIEKFKEKAKRVELAYRNEKGTDETSVATTGEDIADITGVSCIIDACGNDKYKQRKMFEKYAQIWYAVYTDEYRDFMDMYGDHSGEKYRVNTVLKNFTQFRSVYNITKNDKMYLDEKDSLKIW